MVATFDDLTNGLKSPMWSVTAPATTQVRDESGQPTDQLISIPEDGDTKSADPESWMKESDYEKKTPVNKKPMMDLGGLGIRIFQVNIDGPGVMNFVDNKRVPSGEIWINATQPESENIRNEILWNVIYCFMVSRNNYDRNTAAKVANTVCNVSKQFDKRERSNG